MKQKKPTLLWNNIKGCLEFAKKHDFWIVKEWNHVIFSNESKINRFSLDGRALVLDL